MSLLNQKTIKKPVKFQGVGLHSGKLVNVCLKSSKPDTGIIFKRIDVKGNNLVYPNFMNVSNTSLNTTISNSDGIQISTIEHLMGALFGLGIDNVLVEIDNEEVPILDGSAKEFIDGERFISIEPSKLSLDIDFELKFKNKIIGNQRNKINLYEDDLNEVFNSRTFCLYEDIEAIKKIGLAKGGSLDNAIVVKNDQILNKNGLRNSKEFVNHKILDCIGDLFTSGYRIIGSVKCSRGGHYLTNQILRKVFSNNENFSIIEIQERNLPHTLINRSLLRSIA